MVYGETLGMSTLCIKENPKSGYAGFRVQSCSCIGRKPREGGLLQFEVGHDKFRTTLSAEHYDDAFWDGNSRPCTLPHMVGHTYQTANVENHQMQEPTFIP